jgi:type II secretory pathway pseudopilin PulG
MRFGSLKWNLRCWKLKYDVKPTLTSSISSRTRFTISTPDSQKGFTLVELLIVTGISIVIGGLAIGIIVNNTGFTKDQSSTINSNVSLNNVMSQIQNDIRESAAVATGYPAINPTYTTSTTTLVLKLASLNGNGVIDNVFDYVIYHQDSQNAKILHRVVVADAQSTRQSSDQIMTTILDSVTYYYLDSNSAIVTATSAVNIKVTLSMLDKSGSIGTSKSATSITTLRNML